MGRKAIGTGMVVALIMGLTNVMPAQVAAQDLMELLGGPKAPSGKKLEKLIAEPQVHPLGSQENPVRAEMPEGQRAYLARLRCADGKRPQFERVGSFGVGVFGRMIDGYDVLCDGSTPEKSRIFMDMYHPDHREAAAVAGFTIEPA